MLRRTLCFFVVSWLLCVSRTEAQSLGVSGMVGTLGLGAQAGIVLNDYTALRAGLGILPFKLRTVISDNEYDLTLPSPNGMVFLDVFPTTEGFRFSAGLLVSHEEYELTSVSTGEIEIGNRTYGPDEIHTLRGTIYFSDLVPYLGAGYGSTNGEGWGVTIDLGVGFRSPPEVVLTALGPESGSVAGGTNLLREEREISEAIHNLRFYPVAVVGIRVPLR